jgi:excisionase family DNA binding protein
MEQLLTIKDAAAAMRVSTKAAYAMVAGGTIPGSCVVRLGGRVRIDPVRLREFLESGGSAASPARRRRTGPRPAEVATEPGA